MEKQLIISVGREFGSGGHEVAQKLADDYGIALYDHDLLKEAIGEKAIRQSPQLCRRHPAPAGRLYYQRTASLLFCVQYSGYPGKGPIHPPGGLRVSGGLRCHRHCPPLCLQNLRRSLAGH